MHAPHTPCSHPRWVPVSARSSRSASASVLRASTVIRRGAPFTVSATVTGSSTSCSVLGLGHRPLPCLGDHRHADPAAVGGRHLRVVGHVVDVGERQLAELGVTDGADGLCR